ncbi:MAG: hypothetical protein ACOYNB_05885 [Aquabacterium sp.]|uniref:hypothetical protein n=1 Tax=Aquabacterium sp. TaxID=1872578 RepID=UPI003BC9E23F
MAMPAAVVLCFPVAISAWYFKVSILIQLAMQLNYLFGIEYHVDSLIGSKKEVGYQNALRVSVSLLVFLLAYFFYPITLSLIDLLVFLFYICCSEIYSNFRFSMVVRGEFSGGATHAFLLSAVPFFSAVIFRNLLGVLLAQSLSLLLLAVLLAQGGVGLLRVPSRGWISDFAGRVNLAAPAIWGVTRFDRLALPVLGAHLADGYMVAGAVSDALFGTLRQAQFMSRSGDYVRMFAFGVAIWLVCTAILGFIKGFEWDHMFFLPPVMQLLAAFLVVWSLRKKGKGQ